MILAVPSMMVTEAVPCADTMRGLVGDGVGKLFMLFVVLALVYVIIVFLDLTANTFAKKPAVATASGWFILVAVIFGFLMRGGKFSLGQLALIFFQADFAGWLWGIISPWWSWINHYGYG